MPDLVKPTPTAAQAAPKVLDTAAAAKAEPAALPPAGHAREEEKKRRYDELMAATDAFAADFGDIAPEKLDPANVDNEIARFGVDGSVVQGALPGFVYKWEQADIHNRHGGVWVTQSKGVGWVVVDSKMPEERTNGRVHVDGTRRWGDTILMRMPRERWELVQAADRRMRIARTEGIALSLLEEAERKGVKVYDVLSKDAPASVRGRFAQAQKQAGEAARSTLVNTMRQAGRGGATRVLANELANQKLTDAIREGTVPGLTPGA